MASGAGWEFCRTSIPEPAFLCLLEVEKNLLKLRQILLELLKRCRNALGIAGMFRNSVGNVGMFWNAILQYKHLQALVEPTLSPCFLGGREGSTFLLAQPPLIGCSLLSLTSVGLLN